MECAKVLLLQGRKLRTMAQLLERDRLAYRLIPRKVITPNEYTGTNK
jgi:hypothetical protein